MQSNLPLTTLFYLFLEFQTICLSSRGMLQYIIRISMSTNRKVAGIYLAGSSSLYRVSAKTGPKV